MAAITERKDNAGKVHYRALVRIKGAKPVSASFERLTDARKWAGATEAAIRERRYFPNAEGLKHTLAEAIDRYCEEVLPGKKIATQRIQIPQFEWWKNELGHLVLADVGPDVIVKARQSILKSGKCPAVANRFMAALSHLFTMCVREWRWLQHNPFSQIKRFQEPHGRERFLSDVERKTLLDECAKSKNPNLYDVVVLALSTGCRKDEILTLRWKHVDFERNVITLMDTKNGEIRLVPLVGHAKERLWARSRIRRLDCDFVFPYPHLAKPADIDRPFAIARDRAGLPDFRFHDLRHSAASYLAMNGATLPELAAVLGHKTLAMVKRYAHFTQAHTSGIVAKMNAAIFSEPAQGAKEQA